MKSVKNSVTWKGWQKLQKFKLKHLKTGGMQQDTRRADYINYANWHFERERQGATTIDGRVQCFDFAWYGALWGSDCVEVLTYKDRCDLEEDVYVYCLRHLKASSGIHVGVIDMLKWDNFALNRVLLTCNTKFVDRSDRKTWLHRYNRN